MQQVEKATNERYSRKFNSNDLYFLSLSRIRQCKVLLVPYKTTICDLEIYHISMASYLMKNQLQRKRHPNHAYFDQKHCIVLKYFPLHPRKDRIRPQAQQERFALIQNKVTIGPATQLMLFNLLS